MAEPSQDKLYATTLQTIGAVAKLPIVRVDREAFLRTQFAGSAHLDVILESGPQAVYSAESLRKKANSIIKNSAAKTSAASFATGLPGNPAVMVAAGGADVAQYFGFAINLAQQIAYLFGEDELFDGGGELSEAAQIRVIAYLGAMFGAAGGAALVSTTSKVAGANLGKKVAAKPLTKTAWYPLIKKVGALVGRKVTKKTVEKTITKAVPIVGGVVSGGLTYVTFRPMGHRLADALVANLNGDFDDELELSAEFAASLHTDVVECDAVEDDGAVDGASPGDPINTAHKGWTTRDLQRVLPHVSDNVKAILVYVAQHPNCTTRDLARDLPIKSERSVGPTLNNLTRVSVDMGVFPDKGSARWPFEYGEKTDGYERYDLPAWVREIVLDVLGSS